ncbi:hypothetical protein K6W36_01725 [Acetobacter senegalensis]|nr:hypothetical protein [Acetobacter senegalensis]MCG4259307.1 hypothetical protein [Acetobacter senegalensis]
MKHAPFFTLCARVTVAPYASSTILSSALSLPYPPIEGNKSWDMRLIEFL